MITRNLPNGLVNGLGGEVTKLEPDTITIKICGNEDLPHRLDNRHFLIHRYSFLQRDSKNKVVGARKQFPLKLGYAVTVDKSQGRSLTSLVMDCYNFWRPGQMAVAIGRATTTAGLQVLNYNPYASRLKHTDKVTKFYRQRGIVTKPDLNCCRVAVQDVPNAITFSLPTLEMDDSTLTNYSHNTRSNRKLKENFPWDVKKFLMALSTHTNTPNQQLKRKLISGACTSPQFKTFLQEQYNFIKSLCTDYRLTRKGRKCNLCFMTAHLHRYLTSDVYLKQCKSAFQKKSVTHMENLICTDVCMKILQTLCEEESNKAKSDLMKEQLSNAEVDNNLDCNVKSTLRYVAGTAIQSVCRRFRNNMSKTKNHSIKKEVDYYSLRILNCLRSPQGTVEEQTEHPESVMSVIRKQGRKQSLTHVSDNVLKFFELMYIKMTTYFTTDLLKLVGDRILSDCIEALHNNETLISHWFQLFEDVPDICQCHLSLLNEENDVSSDEEGSESTNGDETELQHSIILDLYRKISVFMCRVMFADIRGQYVNTKRKKKLPLRMKLRAENNIEEVKKSKVPYPCAVCEKECKSFFTTFAEQCSMLKLQDLAAFSMCRIIWK